jgi:4-amino-4-deoxy-L-arabinose transferase-like glycosyltransferase
MLSSKRLWYAVWLLLIGAFAVLHALNLRADFPNHSPWWMDWAKYTDEGWYGNAAIRAHLFGSWYLAGDFNPAVGVPVWPFLEWVLFFFTGVTVEAARGLAIAFFFANLLLSYLLLRARGPRWVGLLAVTLMVTSPFLYCFSRLAILEPMLTALTLGALNLGVRLPGFRRPVWVAAGIGLLFTLMMLTKSTALFLLPALGWAMVVGLWRDRRVLVRCGLAAGGAFAVSFGLWAGLVIHAGMLPDYKYLFVVNKYPKPTELYWPFVSLWWSFHGGLWVDRILIPLAGLVVVGAALGWCSARGRSLLLDPVFGASALAVAGYILFMAVQNHPQPRYFAVVAVLCFLIVPQGAGALFAGADGSAEPVRNEPWRQHIFGIRAVWLGWAMLILAGLAVGINGAQTLDYAAHPEYTFVEAAERLTRYIDQHPNGKRLLASVSGDQIALVTHLPAINDLFDAPSPGIPDMAAKLGVYQPGWFATWNTIDAGTLEDIHSHYSLEQVASFRAFDDSKRNVLVLFKLHPWPGGQVYDPSDQNLRIRFPEDKIDIPLE